MAIGKYALQENDGDYNIAIGKEALRANTKVEVDNAAIGKHSFRGKHRWR